MTQAQPKIRTGARSTNLVLTVIAVLLAFNLLRPIDTVGTAAAQPAPDERTNAAEQRKQMMTQISSLEKHMEKIEAQLTKGLKITEMPELKLPAEMKEALKAAARADKPEKSDKPEAAAR